ncbi:ribonuclease D [Pimelobacter simplex]|uniref:ribonuclease D n=1 Tax=Nocardioides simplex TaxID=2045 RepID=UPI00214F7782|nr:ribonuclease D [Pimelobacter simplex]UUW89909.1 ribonuclease D [Pimelobacter simplex]UUW93738.1 ribonuclease D [Pimelobacter simplex]
MADESTDQPSAPAEAAPVALLTLSEGLPPVIDTPDALAAYCAALAAGSGPVAIDAERASGYRYSNRAYLIQIKREGAGIGLIDPIAFPDLAPLAEAIGDNEWILHAATQDLPCLAEVGLYPSALFDTELAGRLLNYPRVGLATLVEVLLERHLRKEHSAVDWSTRPLPDPWLEYAALDVEVLVELRDLLSRQLDEAGKADWARQEFEHLRGFQPTVRVDAWRRTSGLHKVRGRRTLGAVRALWETRDRIARERDVTPGRLIPDAAVVAAATAMPTSRGALLSTQGFHGRGASRYANEWLAALRTAAELPEDELPTRVSHGDGPPAPRTWADKDPVAARRLELARAAVATISEEREVPLENLLTPDSLRRVMWAPPSTRDPVELLEAVIDQLRGLGARSWQVGLTAPALSRAILDAEAAKAAKVAKDSSAPKAPAKRKGQSRLASSVAEPEGEAGGVPVDDSPSEGSSDE